MSSMTIGHHRIGDCIWYSTFRDTSFVHSLVIPDSDARPDFRTHDDFTKLVTFLHESYHYIQDFTLGLCAWNQLNTDLAAISSQLARMFEHGGGQFSEMAGRAWKEREFLDDITYSSKRFNRILEAESGLRPELAQRFQSCRGLSGQDLMECHAAILTERRIAALRRKYPDAFDDGIMTDLESIFRPEKMRACEKVIRIFHEHLGPGFHFETANGQHPLYPYSPRAAEFGLLLFLLHTALDTCALPSDAADACGAIQDVIPAARFLKLVGSVIPCYLKLKDRAAFMLNEQYLHTEFSRHLNAHINACNAKAAGWFHRTPRSFLSSDEAHDHWLELFGELRAMVQLACLGDLFEPGLQIRISSLKLAKSQPLLIYRTDFASLAVTLGIYPFFSSKEQVINALGCIMMKEVTTPSGRRGYELPHNPYQAMDVHIARQIFLEISEALHAARNFECPVLSRYAFYPCAHRSPQCRSLSRDSVPPCQARTIVDRFFGGTHSS